MEEYIVTKDGVDYKVEYNPQMIDSKEELTKTADALVNELNSTGMKRFKGYGFDYLNLGDESSSVDRCIMVTRLTK